MREQDHGHLPLRPRRAAVSALRTATAAAVLLWLAPVAAQTVLTLPDALRRAGETSVQADTAKLNEASAKEQTREIKSSYYPTITLDGGHTNLDNQPSFKSGPIVFPSSNQAYWQYSFSVRELLWDGGRRSTAMAASRTRESSVTLSGVAAVQEAQAAVADRYVTLLSLRDQRGVVAQRRKALEDYHRVVKDMFDEGMVARNDLLRTEVALRSVEDQASALDNAVSTAQEGLNKSLGLDPTVPHLLPDGLPPPPPLPWDDAACRTRAMDHNYGVQALEEKVKGLGQIAELRRRDYYPNVVAEAGHSYQQNDYLLYPHVNSLFVGISLDVFDGGARAARISQAKLDVDKARRDLEEARRGVSVAVGQAYRDFQEALKEVATARTNVTASEENLRIIEDQYKEGLARTTDVLDAESVLAESRYGVVRMHYQAYAKQAALLAAMGEDLPAFYESGLAVSKGEN